MPIAPLRPGDPRRVGSFRLRCRLGEGGMGEVFLAVDGRGRPVALKTLHAVLAHDEGFRRRFSREVAAVQRVAGRCTARLVAADLAAPRPWLATEFVDGPTLNEYVRSHGQVPGASLTGLAVGLLEALAAIHAVGIVHRDLTPNNVILAADGPKVVDFGIAHHVEASTAITVTGSTLGTPAWMAPEQAEGRPATRATDVFAWGSVVAFAGVGRSPFGEGRPETVLYRIVHADPDLAGLPEPPLAAVRMALRKPADDRPDLSELAEQLGVTHDADLTQATDRTLQNDWTVEATPAVTVPRRRLRSSRTAWLVAAVVPVLIAAATVVVALVTRDNSGSGTADPTPQSQATTTTAAPTTTTATTVPPPPPPTPEDAWIQNLQTLPAGTGGSPVVRVGDVPTAVTVFDAEAQVWEFRESTWTPQQVVPLEIAAITDAQVQTADVTTDGGPDFVVTFSGASRPLGLVLSSATGSWRAVPFETPDGLTITENPTIQGNQLTSYINSCVPSCAEGTLIPNPWTYDAAGAYFALPPGLPVE